MSEDLLKSLGLSPREAKIYLAALELGKALPKHLAQKAGVKRPTLYKALPDLLQKGLLSETMLGKRRVLVAEDPEVYLEKKKGDLAQFERTLPQLRSILSTASVKPVINFYEGVEGMKRVYFDNLRVRKSVSEFIGLEKVHPKIEKYLDEYYIPERIRREIPIKIIVSGKPKYGKLNLVSSEQAFREVKVIDGAKFSFPLDCYIYGDSVSFLVYRIDSEPTAMIIRSKEIAQTMKSIFNFAWDRV